MKHSLKKFRKVGTQIKMIKMNKNVSRWIQAITLCYVNLINYMDRYTVSGMARQPNRRYYYKSCISTKIIQINCCQVINSCILNRCSG